MTIHTVLVDRAGYIVQSWLNTRAATLDPRAYSHLGTLMEATGPVVAGMRHVDGGFYAAPIRPDNAFIQAEAERRINLHFPEGFRINVTALGGDNALKIANYVGTVHKTAENMMAAQIPPSNWKADEWWPSPPAMELLQIPQRVIEHQPYQAAAVQPITVHVAPVINAGERYESGGHVADVLRTGGLPALVQHEAVPTGQGAQFEPVSNVRSLPVKRPSATTVEPLNAGESDGRSGLDPRDPLYALKIALVSAIATTATSHALPSSTVNVLAEIAALGTAANTRDEVEAQRKRVAKVIEGLAA